MSSTNHRPSSNTFKQETVLIMQGGGSLGAYECGVCKVLAKHNIKFDIIAGTSIGAINAAIIAAGYTKEDGIKRSVEKCEDFWMDLAIDNVAMTMGIPAYLPYKERSQLSAAYSFLYGNQKAFTPLWMYGGIPLYYFFNSPYLYDINRLRRTVSKYIDFTKLSLRWRLEEMQKNINGKSNAQKGSRNNNDNTVNTIPKLILIATNIQTGEPVVFDTDNEDITVNHVMASAGYALYGLPCTKIGDSYFWDGAFVHNTPLRAVTKTSKAQKIIYVSDVFPRKQEKLPSNMPETYHRIRDLLFTDRSIPEVKETSENTRKYLSLIEQMHEVIVTGSSLHSKHDSKLKLDKIESEYSNLITNNRGSILDRIVHIQRKERTGRHFIFEDADFSVNTIKELIRQGEEDAKEALQ